jgi:uncharacterized membrane protein
MWYWLEGLINSRLIDRDLLSAIYVVGFLLGVLIGSILLRNVRGRFGWILMVFIGAVCTKALILVFEWLQFYNWDRMTSSPQFLEFCIIFFTVAAALIAILVVKQHRKRKTTSRY